MIWRIFPSSNLLGTGEEINGLKELGNNPIVHWPALVSRHISDMTDIISNYSNSPRIPYYFLYNC